MRFIKNKSGLARTSTQVSHKEGRPAGVYPSFQQESVNSQDTENRQAIYKKVVDMVRQCKEPITIESVLREEYPNYSIYIAQLVSDQLKKQGNLIAKKVEHDGDER